MQGFNPSYPIHKFPRQSLTTVRLSNLLLNKVAGFAFPLENGSDTAVRLRLLPSDISAQLQCPLSFTLELGGTTAGLWLSSWILNERITQFVPADLLPKLPENLAISVVETAQNRLLTQAETALNMKINIQSLSAETESTHYSLPINFELQELSISNQQVTNQLFGVLVVHKKLYPHLQERLRLWPSDPNNEWENHTSTVRFEISRLSLSMQDLNQLNPSDILLLEETHFQQEGRIRLSLDSGLQCDALFTSHEKHALNIISEWMMPMSDQEQKPTIDHIAQVPVQLSFDLGNKTLSFNEIRQLRPGYILELNSQFPEIVQIRSQNKTLGTGELVDVNGRVGVRILNLFGKQAKGS